MKVRLAKQLKDEGSADRFNMHALTEVIVIFETGESDSYYPSDLEVYITAKQEWKPLREAFKDHDVIVDNLNSRFFEPATQEDKERGFTLD